MVFGTSRDLHTWFLKIDFCRPSVPLLHPFSFCSSLYTGFGWHASLHWSQTNPPVLAGLCFVSVREMPEYFDGEYLVFLLGSGLVHEIPPPPHPPSHPVIKPAFLQRRRPDLRAHWNVGQSHRATSIFENDLLWSEWETASVFGHWLERCWKSSLRSGRSRGLIHQKSADGFFFFFFLRAAPLSLIAKFPPPPRCASLSNWTRGPAHRNDDSTIQFAFNQCSGSVYERVTEGMVNMI